MGWAYKKRTRTLGGPIYNFGDSLFTRKAMTDLSKESWYHGRVSRVDAEKILDNAGGGEGTYLVRDSLTITGEYVLSLCHQVNNCVL